jgi:hypothetical protein
MKASILGVALILFLSGCKKASQAMIDQANPATISDQFINYTIQKGNQFCDQNFIRAVETSEMKFRVKFDSTAIYQTLDAGNQYDINKLYGFSDNNADHHQFSARFGWRWSDSALRLFAYVYNEGAMSSKELTTVAIGAEIHCSIKVEGNRYLFTVNELTEEMPRMSLTDKGKGYQLYPYFGGDETAPHLVDILIRETE